MVTKIKYTEEELSLFEGIHSAILEKTENKIAAKIKTGHHKIDEAGIEKQCTTEFFSEFEGQVSQSCKYTDDFLALLKHDDAKLYEQLSHKIEHYSADFEKVKNFHDLVKFGKHLKFSEPMLEKIFQIGTHHYKTGHYQNAFLYFNWLCSVEGDNPQMWFLKGVVEQNLERYNDALISYYGVIALHQDFIPVYTQLMNCLLLMGNKKAAKEVYDIFTKNVDPSAYKHDKTFVENLHCLKDVLF